MYGQASVSQRKQLFILSEKTQGFLAQSGKGRAREHKLQRGCTSAEV